jgi:aryl-alcohol dehydrogenase-like predicted oxidoreductase
MRYVKLGNTDITISAIIMGTWQAGKAMWADIDDAQTAKAIMVAFDKGITTFDTATVYGNGHSERILAKALEGIRQEAVIATKVFAHSLEYEKVLAACHQSLKDLKTDYIDLYQIHWPAGSFGSKAVPLAETMEALSRLREQGKIRAIGVSNFSRKQLEEACEFGLVESLQPPYSLFWRQVEKETIPFCREKRITLLAYSSMAQGILTGKFDAAPRFLKGDHRAKNRLFEPENYKRVQEALARLKPIADRNHITLGQLALAWVISHPNTCAIAGARNPEQSAQNAAAGDIVLSPNDLEEMDAIGRIVTDPLDDNPVLWKW